MSLNSILLISILFFNSHLSAQKNPINYLNQKPPDTIAQLFAPGIISTDALEHSAPAFSPDGKTVVWTIMKMPSYQMCLMEMNFENHKWSIPHPPSFSDTTVNEVYPDFFNGW